MCLLILPTSHMVLSQGLQLPLVWSSVTLRRKPGVLHWGICCWSCLFGWTKIQVLPNELVQRKVAKDLTYLHKAFPSDIYSGLYTSLCILVFYLEIFLRMCHLLPLPAFWGVVWWTDTAEQAPLLSAIWTLLQSSQAAFKETMLPQARHLGSHRYFSQEQLTFRGTSLSVSRA